MHINIKIFEKGKVSIPNLIYAFEKRKKLIYPIV